MGHPKVSTIVLNWNNAADTGKCITSLLEQDYKNVDIFVVDNGSTDGSGRVLQRRFGTISNIKLILLKENTGFAEGNNVGIRRALENAADYVLMLNNDVVVTPHCIATLVEVAESDDHIGIVGATNLFLHDPTRIWYSGGVLHWARGRFIDETSNTLYDPNDRRIREVDDVAGSSMMVKRAVIEKVGLLWAPYFLCYEESDWCLRAKRGGFRVLAAMGATVYHAVHASMSEPNELYYMNRNYPLFMLRNCPPLMIPIAIMRYIINIFINYLRSLLKKDDKRAVILRRAFFDFLLHRYGEKRVQDISNLIETKGK